MSRKKKKTVVVKVTYSYEVSYSHPEHLEMVKEELRRSPRFAQYGSAVARDGDWYPFSLELKGKGEIL